jgi:tetratricopeptide (TPR) repeat protein
MEGIPLAIELAAGWAQTIPCAQIARELARSLDFLAAAPRDLPARHRGMRAVFDHSWNLLDNQERAALRQLAVFRGGFSNLAAEQAAGVSLRLLAALVDKSLVRRGVPGGPAHATGRYDLLEVVRQYAAEKLAEAQRDGDAECATIHDRHGAFYMAYLHQRTADLRSERQQIALAEIHLESENIRAAWRWAIARGHVALIGQAADSLFFFYEMRSWFHEGADMFAQAAERLAELAASGAALENRVVWGKVLARRGWFTFQVGRQAEARGLLEQSLAILRPLDRPAELVFPLNYLAAATFHAGDYAAANQLGEEALAVSQACGDRHGVAIAKTILGQIAYLVGAYPEARRYSQESLALEQELGNRWGTVFTLLNLGLVAYALREYPEAQRWFQEGLAIREALGDTRGIALCLSYLGHTAAAQADYAAAERLYRECLARFKEVGSQAGVATALTRLGYTALAAHQPAGARAHFHEALRTAWNAQAMPQILDALAGIAAARADTDPYQAYELTQLVRRHPATTQEGRNRAIDLLARLTSPAASPASMEERWQAPQLDAVVAAILSER